MAERYTPEDYIALDIGEYRRRFGDETKGISDERLFDLVMGTDDDLDDDQWIALFKAEQAKAHA